jgi:hypothetical protein
MNIVTDGGHFDTYDGIETFLVTESMVLKHSAKVYPDSPSIQKLHFNIHQTIANNEWIRMGKPFDLSAPLEPIYVYRSLLLSAIAVPFYYAALFFSISPIVAVALFSNPLVLSLTAVVIFCFSLEIFRSKKIAFVLSLIFGLCSFAWSYSTTMLPQPLQALLIISSAYFTYKAAKQSNNNNIIKRNVFAGSAGVLLGFSLFAHPASAIVIPAFVTYTIFSMRRNKKSLVTFLVMLGVVISFAGLVNYWRFGLFTEFGYGKSASLSNHNGWEGLVGLLISPGKGIIFYFPIVILLPLAIRYMYREDRGLSVLFIYVIFAYWLFFGTDDWAGNGQGFLTTSWAGNVGWGPRYLLPTLPFIAIAFGALLTRLKNRLFLKISTVVLCAISFFVSLLGTIVWYQYGLAYGWEREGLWQYDHITFRNNMTVSSWDIMTWFPQYSPIILHMKVLISDYLSKLPAELAYTHAPNTDYHYIGLAPCPYDMYIYCKAGIIPMLLLACIESAIVMNILMEIYEKPIFKTYVNVKRQK